MARPEHSALRLPAPGLAGVLAALLLLLLPVALVRMEYAFSQAGIVDFTVFLEYADQFRSRGELYSRDLARYEPAAAIYKFPPLAAAVMVVLRDAGWDARWMVSVGCWAMLLAVVLPSVGLMWGYGRARRGLSLLAGLVVLLLCGPLLEENLLRMQLEPVLFACLALALVAWQREREWLAGALVGLAACLKIYPAALLLVFLVARRWRPLFGAALAGVLVTAWTLFVLGWEEHRFFLVQVLPVLLQEPPAVMAENIAPANWYAWHLPGLAPWAGRFLLLAGLYLACRLATAKTGSSRLPVAWGIGAALLALQCGMPNTWWNYQLLLLLPLLLLVTDLCCGDRPGRQVLPLLGGVLLVLLALYAGASMTVDDRYYGGSLPAVFLAQAGRTLAPLVLLHCLVSAARLPR